MERADRMLGAVRKRVGIAFRITLGVASLIAICILVFCALNLKYFSRMAQ